MKVSKVRFNRVGVGKNKQDIQGILYSPERVLDIENQFRKLNVTAQRLYNLFNPVNLPSTVPAEKRRDGTDNPKYYEYQEKAADVDVVQKLNKILRQIMFSREGMLKLDVIISKLQGSNEDMDDPNRILERVPSLYLRKSLKSDADGCTELLKALMGMKADFDKIKLFLELVQKDYRKDNTAHLIAKAIKNQNMHVQPADRKLEISGSTEKVKTGKYKVTNAVVRQGLKSFVNAYADLNPEHRTDMLRKIRRILDLYFATPTGYEGGPVAAGEALPAVVRTDAFDPFEDHVQARDNKETFVFIPEELDNDEVDWESTMTAVERKNAMNEMQKKVRERNMRCFQYSKAMIEAAQEPVFFEQIEISLFLIKHIEDAVERITDGIYGNWQHKKYRLVQGYLSEKVWKDILNLLSIKYIAKGKAVYHFILADKLDALAEKDPKEAFDLVKVKQDALDGITSFDYEMIHAGEKLQREAAVKVMTAANNLSRATMDADKQNEEGTEDFFLIQPKATKNAKSLGYYLQDPTPGETIREILQFFGGKSMWDTSVIEDAYKNKESADVAFLNDMKAVLYSLRNSTFHFTTIHSDKAAWNTELVGAMFEKDAERTAHTEKNKMYSNNLPMFYKQADLKELMDLLYSEYTGRAAQIPSFNTVFVRKEMKQYLLKYLPKEVQQNLRLSDENRLKFENALYYVFKEIYYNLFLKEADKYVYGAWENYYNEMLRQHDGNTKDKELRAPSDFNNKFQELRRKEYRFDQFCQAIMTEYNMQNQKQQKKKSYQASKNNPDIFKHYPLFLKMILRDGFLSYLDKQTEKLGFLRHPSMYEMPAVEAFLPDYRTKTFERLVNTVKNDPSLQSWYITGRFLSGKDLNHLVGSVRSYLQYADDVKRRAETTRNPLHIKSMNAKRLRKVAEVLDFCLKCSGMISHEVSDYFGGEEAAGKYAAYLERYLDYGHGETPDISHLASLDLFCNEADMPVGIYMDGKNPILNRNVILSKMFGPERILENAIAEKVTETTIGEYMAEDKKLANYRKKGYTESAAEQMTLLRFQRLKNRIEFRDIAEYGDVINELHGQLVNFSYLRERDLFYFQLGFHYSCLMNETEKPASYKAITTADPMKIKAGAILYQICALYINGLGVFRLNNGKTPDVLTRGDKQKSAGGKISDFAAYTSYMMKNEPALKVPSKYDVYLAGMEVFENVQEHDNIVALRNYIDHFKYYAKADRSLLSLYSEVFDRFFTYDMKYQKQVMNLMENILLGHFVIARLYTATGTKLVGEGGAIREKSCAKIEVGDFGVSSDAFTYKIGKDGGEPVLADARNGEFLKRVTEILYYPETVDSDQKLSDKVKTDIQIKMKDKTHTGAGGKKQDKKDKQGDGYGRKKGGRPEKGRKVSDKELEKYSSGSVGTSLSDLFKNIKL